ncbi:protein mono-ADP-ribosyltransferase PARP9 isoform X2 [Bufo gargarizans]|uniref:protein mono-ADP-ribosyltransferase PARP9 isoform X2 n=1 Tax=Bufo gargarizans TaxID=30331 RepID=UPI001CF2552B|nr:protein mono-ADP-ribosyltransferase PARP9 isoform X2 [Bufo gargarizans]
MEQVCKVTLPEDVHRVLLSCKTNVNDLFIRKFRCTAEVSGHRPAATTAPVPVYEKLLRTGQLISVWRGDLTTQDTDVVVNAANDHLEHIGGLARALVEAGGQQIVQESQIIISQRGVLAAGDIEVTSAGTLPSKHIVHAVGPRWSEGTAEKCKGQLRQAIRKVLEYVSSQRDLSSVAIPAVSSGIFGFPLDLCASIIVEVVVEHCRTEHVSRLKEIRLVNHDDKTVQAMKSACEQGLGQSDALSGAASSSSAQAWHQGASSQMTTPLTVNGLNLHLKTGKIEEEKTSVIVNSISSDLDLTRGAISSAIYSRAGPKLQEEVWRKGHSFSNMISTRGPNLPCHFVYHVILATGETNVEKTLQEVTKKCLMTAHTHKSSSISFPALGTGNMGLQKHKVADIMTQAVLDFARLHQSSMEVNFVIHPLDVETFQAFLDKFKASRITNVKNMEFTKNPKGPEPSDEGMCVTISGECGEDVAEAAAWLQGVLSPSPTPLLLHNNLLLLFGSEEIDALASCPASVEMEEDLRDGRVTLKISGPLPDRIVAAVQVERLLLDVQNELAQSLEAELLEAAVTWFYESPSESHRYPAKANRELEKAFASRRNFVLSAPPGHVINFDNDTAMERERKYTLRRRCLRDSFQNIQTSPLPSLEVERSSPEFREQSTEFRKAGLILQKMEKVQNELLFRVFQSKKDAARARRSETLYQLVPRQFCRDICDVGFHRVYGTPRDTRYGSGVYFKKSLPNITQRFQCPEKDGLLCVLQAEVLAGDFTKYARNQPSLPCIGSDALQVYEGLVDGGMPAEHYVIFDLFPSQSPVCVHLQT